jgi:hypothetical protein
MRLLDQVVSAIKSFQSFIAAGQFKQAEEAACSVIKNIYEDAPTLGLDLDGTIDESPEFFRILTSTWPGKVIIVTYRKDAGKAAKDLQKLSIYYDKLVLADSLDKSELIKSLGINVYIDDQDECIQNIDQSISVMKFRNGGNFNNGKWMYSDRTGKPC